MFVCVCGRYVHCTYMLRSRMRGDGEIGSLSYYRQPAVTVSILQYDGGCKGKAGPANYGAVLLRPVHDVCETQTTAYRRGNTVIFCYLCVDMCEGLCMCVCVCG